MTNEQPSVSDNGWTFRTLHSHVMSAIDSLKEAVKAQNEGIKTTFAILEKLYDERDVSRKTAVDAALMAAKEQTKANFDASEKAIVKAEEAQKAYNASHNDLARKMDEQNKGTVPRPEIQQRFQTVEKDIADIRQQIAAGQAGALGGRQSKDDSRASMMQIIAVVSIIIAAAALASKFLVK